MFDSVSRRSVNSGHSRDSGARLRFGTSTVATSIPLISPVSREKNDSRLRYRSQRGSVFRRSPGRIRPSMSFERIPENRLEVPNHSGRPHPRASRIAQFHPLCRGPPIDGGISVYNTSHMFLTPRTRSIIQNTLFRKRPRTNRSYSKRKPFKSGTVLTGVTPDQTARFRCPPSIPLYGRRWLPTARSCGLTR